MPSFVLLNVTIEGGIRITARATAVRGIMFHWCLGADFLDILQFTTWTRALGRAKENFVMFLEGFQIPLPLIFILLLLLYTSSPVSQAPSQVFLDRLLVGPLSKVIFLVVRFIFTLGNSSLNAHHTVTLITLCLVIFLHCFFCSVSTLVLAFFLCGDFSDASLP